MTIVLDEFKWLKHAQLALDAAGFAADKDLETLLRSWAVLSSRHRSLRIGRSVSRCARQELAVHDRGPGYHASVELAHNAVGVCVRMAASRPFDDLEQRGVADQAAIA